MPRPARTPTQPPCGPWSPSWTGKQNAQITALEEIDPDNPAAPAMRARIRDRFAQLHAQRTDAETRLAALVSAAKPKAADPAILDE